jgi:hypothetical protein
MSGYVLAVSLIAYSMDPSPNISSDQQKNVQQKQDRSDYRWITLDHQPKFSNVVLYGKVGLQRKIIHISKFFLTNFLRGKINDGVKLVPENYAE